MSWLKLASLQANKPKESVIGILKKNLGGPREGRSREQLHASDITKPTFCPRYWAFADLEAKKCETEFINTALAVTYDMGKAAETMLVEEWAGQATKGNWECRLCGEQRSMCSKPNGFCPTGKRHWWKYNQTVIEAPELGIIGSIDALFDIGAPLWAITEIKTMAPEEWDKIVMPLPEHRLRTCLYMKLVEESNHGWKELFNTMEARVLYICRAHGRMHPQWNEILPFKEYVVKRDDESLADILKRAGQLRRFRQEKQMPAGICETAIDRIAKKCGFCIQCFSGNWPAQQEPL